MHSILKNRAIAAITAAALSLTLFACGGGYSKKPQPSPMPGPYASNPSGTSGAAAGR